MRLLHVHLLELIGLFNVVFAAHYSQFSMRKLDHDPCYHHGRPVHCTPDFINAAYGKPVVASSTCGQVAPTRFCMDRKQSDGSVREKCDVCDATVRSQAHPASVLTELNNSPNLTCWVSQPSVDYSQNVSLTVSLGKKFELTYVSLQFCNRPADSLVIYKSMDFGKTWTPFQYYSSECWKMYGKLPNAVIRRSNEQEAVCTRATSSPSDTRVAFATLEGRPSALNFAYSPVLQDWVTATDIKIVFHRHIQEQNELYGVTNEVTINHKNPEKLKQRSFYSLSELSVGGRCKCNGHASRCIFDNMGNYVCDCKHNTAGTECERCKQFYFDRPWGRGTLENANACSMCSCNLHSKKCRFNMELYKMSDYKSGGICIKCKHNTAGRNCHYCKPGFYRNYEQPLTSPKACQPCDCHPIGSLSRSCNSTSGQCVCKNGVTGLKCNRCAQGYQQSSSALEPCTPEVSTRTSAARPEKCPECKKSFARLNYKKFCKRDYAIEAQVVSRKVINGWTKFQLEVRRTFNRDGFYFPKRGEETLWIRNSNVLCGCPRMAVRQRYLLLGRTNQEEKELPGIVFSPKSVLMEWDEELFKKLIKMVKKEDRGQCPAHRIFF